MKYNSAMYLIIYFNHHRPLMSEPPRKRATPAQRLATLIPFLAHRADQDTPNTLLSVLSGARSIGKDFFSFLTLTDARCLRLVSEEMRVAVSEVPCSYKTTVTKNMGGWQKSFPKATNVHVRCKEEIDVPISQ